PVRDPGAGQRGDDADQDGQQHPELRAALAAPDQPATPRRGQPATQIADHDAHQHRREEPTHRHTGSLRRCSVDGPGQDRGRPLPRVQVDDVGDGYVAGPQYPDVAGPQYPGVVGPQVPGCRRSSVPGCCRSSAPGCRPGQHGPPSRGRRPFTAGIRREAGRCGPERGGRMAGMTSHQTLLGGPPPTLLPDNDEAAAALAGGADPVEVASRWPAYSEAWAELADRAFAAGRTLDRTLESYAYARVGYHRGLDALRRNGWKGPRPIPRAHPPNPGLPPRPHPPA